MPVPLLAAIVSILGWIYQVDPAICNGCGNCLGSCPVGAISMHSGDAFIDPELCTGCGICVNYCPRGAIYRTWYTSAPHADLSLLHAPSPNPTAGMFTVSAPEGCRIEVVDMAGRVVASTTSPGDEASLDISGQAPGTYAVMAGGEPAGSVVLLAR